MPSLGSLLSSLALSSLALVQAAPISPTARSFAPSPAALYDGSVLGGGQARYQREYDLGAHVSDTAVGGLSGLDWLGGKNFIAISDDKGDHGPVRAYQLQISPDATAKVTGQVTFTNADGSDYDPAVFDPEEIRVLPNGHFLWTSEGQLDSLKNRAPVIVESDSAGREVRRISPPAYHHPNLVHSHGMRPNKGPEAMAVAPDGSYFVTANENALAQDGPVNTAETGAATRLTFYDTATGRPTRELVLPIDPLYPGAEDRGVASLAFDAKGNLYALERGYLPKVGNRGEIYRLNLDGATDVLGQKSLTGAEKPVSRTKVFDFEPVTTQPGNVEGLAVAQVSSASGEDSSGEQVQFTMIADNNFSDKQKTLVHTAVSQ